LWAVEIAATNNALDGTARKLAICVKAPHGRISMRYVFMLEKESMERVMKKLLFYRREIIQLFNSMVRTCGGGAVLRCGST
jgi:hypothetical protein